MTRYARQLHTRTMGTSRIQATLYELDRPFEFAYFSHRYSNFTHLAVWQFPPMPWDSDPATQLVGYEGDPQDPDTYPRAHVLETWTDDVSNAEALENAEVFGPEGSGYRIW